jgi:hypothetical protein
LCSAIDGRPACPDLGKAKEALMPADPSPHDRRPREQARLRRQFERLRVAVPWLGSWIDRLLSDRAAMFRFPLGILLIVGGIFSILPFLGVWMLPLGLMLLAVDVPALRRPVASVIIRVRRWWENRRRARKG